MSIAPIAPPVGADVVPPVEPTKKRMSKWQLYWRRFSRNRPAVGGLIIFAVLVVFALAGGLFAQWDHVKLDFLALSKPPSAGHWFGTTGAGNDLYALTVVGLQRSLIIAVCVSLGTSVVSAIVGTAAAYFGGRVEKVTLWVIHFLMVVPTFLLLAMISNDSGGDWRVITIVLIIFGWYFQARTIWAMSLSLRERDYIRAAKYMGVPGLKIVLRHMLPNNASFLIINFALGVVAAVLAETGLSFLGFGVKIPDVSLGSLIGSGANAVSSSPWLFYFPGGILVLLTVSMAFIADGLRDALDPSSAAGGRA